MNDAVPDGHGSFQVGAVVTELLEHSHGSGAMVRVSLLVFEGLVAGVVDHPRGGVSDPLDESAGLDGCRLRFKQPDLLQAERAGVDHRRVRHGFSIIWCR